MRKVERASSTSSVSDDVPFDIPERCGRDDAVGALSGLFSEPLRSRASSPAPSACSVASSGGGVEGRKRRNAALQVALQQVNLIPHKVFSKSFCESQAPTNSSTYSLY